jgi:hypothetical protein
VLHEFSGGSNNPGEFSTPTTTAATQDSRARKRKLFHDEDPEILVRGSDI